VPVPRKQMVIITRDEYAKLLKAVPEHYRLLVRTLAETGIRWGEALALRPEDLDAGDVLHVHRVMSDLGAGEDRFPVKLYTKNQDRREVKISASLADAIRKVKTDGYLFRAVRGGNIARGYFHEAVWVPSRAKAGLEKLRVHDLRHSHASWLLASGCDVATVAERLGHHDIYTTARYLHAMRDSGDRAVTALESYLSNSNAA
jgi:integrase